MGFRARKPLAAVCVLLALLAAALPMRVGAEILNQAKVHEDYNNGDFDKVQQELDAFKSHNKTYSHDDSVFIAKHLAVIYAANPETREKGRYYMFQLLDLLPSARIVDMFVSEEIDRIFEKVKEEFKEKQLAMGKTPSPSLEPEHGNPDPDKGTPRPIGRQPSEPKKSSSAKYWVTGGVSLLAVGVGAGAYFLMAKPAKAQDKVYVIDKQIQ